MTAHRRHTPITLAEVAPEFRQRTRIVPPIPISTRLGRWAIRKAAAWFARAKQVDGVRVEKRTIHNHVDLRDFVSYTRHIYTFYIPKSLSTISNLRHNDKAQLRATIFALHAQGLSYRQIEAVVDLHWTRVQQIVKSAE